MSASIGPSLRSWALRSDSLPLQKKPNQQQRLSSHSQRDWHGLRFLTLGPKLLKRASKSYVLLTLAIDGYVWPLFLLADGQKIFLPKAAKVLTLPDEGVGGAPGYFLFQHHCKRNLALGPANTQNHPKGKSRGPWLTKHRLCRFQSVMFETTNGELCGQPWSLQ